MSLPDNAKHPHLGRSLRKKSSNSSIIQKLFSRHATVRKSPLTKVGAELPERLEEASDGDGNVRVTPCPYIYPLTSDKLEPRTESAPLIIRRSKAGSSMTMLRLKGESSRDARSRLTVIDVDGELEDGSLSVETLNLLNLRLREDIAAAATADAAHLKEWGYYVKCYSEGRFNLILPPEPPPRNQSFKYLPSTYPTNEVDRLFTAKMCLLEWSKSTRRRARLLILEVMEAFQSPCASISFFNRNMEIVKVNYGYCRNRIPRSESLASHVLLTNEVMTVLDTHNDWRFAGSPLVTGEPKIRFFAGAPLLSSNSEVVGVISIFAPQPRTTFTAMQRRELTDYCAIAVRDLTSLRDVNHDESLRSTPILRRESPIDGRTRLSRTYSIGHERINSLESGLIPAALHYRKCVEPMKPKHRMIIDRGSADMHSGVLEQTPPNSDDSDSGTSPVYSQIRGFGKNHKHLSLNSMNFQPRRGEITPESPTREYHSFDDLPPRPFSGSDLTSVDNVPHPCTPDSGYIVTERGLSITAEDITLFLNKYGDSTSSEVVSNSSLPDDSPIPGKMREGTSLFPYGLDAPAIQCGEDIVPSMSLLTTRPSQVSEHDRATVASVSTDDSGGDLTVELQTEARFAAELWAKILRFDAVYAVELKPRKPHLSDAELKAPGGMRVRILVSCGLNDGVDIDVPIHLQALRARDAITYENDSGDVYSRGFMMSMVPEKAFKSRGIVFGAFRKAPKDGSILPSLNSAEIDRLSKACKILRDILYKPNASDCPSRSRSEPPPSLQAYPANEAVEVGKYSLDAGRAQMASGRKLPKRQPLPTFHRDATRD